jgi:hypothetical protein
MPAIKIINPSVALSFLSPEERATLSGTLTGKTTADYRGGRSSQIGPTYNTTRGLLAPKGFYAMQEILLFQYNPSEISDAKANTYTERASTGYSAPRYFWGKGGARTMSFSLFFDATAHSNNKSVGQNTEYGPATVETLSAVFPNGVMDMVNKLNSFMYPILDDSPYTGVKARFVEGAAIPGKRFLPPPVAVFVFGYFYLECVVMTVDAKYTLFNERLQPIRAECTVSLNILEASIVNVDERLRQKTLEEQIRDYDQA